MHKPLVTIGIPTHNRPHELRRAILSALHQTYKNTEIIISENPSRSDSYKAIADILDKRTLFFKQNKNIGPIKNFEFLLKKASGDYFMWLSDDDILKEDFIEKCVYTFSQNKDAIAVTTRFQYFSENELFGLFEEKTIDFSKINEKKENIIAIIHHNYGNIFYSLYKREKLFFNGRSILEITKMDSGNEIPFFIFLSSQGNFFVLNGVHFFKRTNLNTYIQARWEKQGGMIPNWKKILEDKNSIKNYHIKALLETKDIIKKLYIPDQWKLEIKEEANKSIIKHYKKMIESAEDTQNKETIFIGMPVYNGERFIYEAINSIINQTYTNWILFISDNNSQDKTFEIAQYFSNKDPRIICVKKWNNIGAIKNFEFTLMSSYCNYFKWMAHDDILENTFLEKCIHELKRDESIMFVCTGIRNIDSFHRTVREYPGFHALATNSITKNVKKFLLHPEILGKANLIYSVFRTKFCKEIWNTIQIPECWGGDMVFMLAAIARGKYKILPDVLFNKRYCRETDSQEQIDEIIISDPENHIFPLEEYEEYKNALLRATLNTKYYFLTEKIMEKRYQKALSSQ